MPEHSGKACAELIGAVGAPGVDRPGRQQHEGLPVVGGVPALEGLGHGIPARLHPGVEKHVAGIIYDAHSPDHARGAIYDRRVDVPSFRHRRTERAIFERQQAPHRLIAFDRLHEQSVLGGSKSEYAC